MHANCVLPCARMKMFYKEFLKHFSYLPDAIISSKLVFCVTAHTLT